MRFCGAWKAIESGCRQVLPKDFEKGRSVGSLSLSLFLELSLGKTLALFGFVVVWACWCVVVMGGGYGYL